MEQAKESGNICEYTLARRPTYLKIKLDVILNNLRILKSRLASHTEIIAVLKANAYGHGSVPVSRFLEKNGFTNVAVATSLEGEELRSAGVHGNIHILGNACEEDIPTLYRNNLVPTTADVQFLSSWLFYWQQCQNGEANGETDTGAAGQVVVNVDSGMSRNGCQPEELPAIMQFCEKNFIPVHSLMTHFAQSWDDPVFTQKQLDIFMKAVLPYRQKGIKLHVANSGAILNNVGVDLDYVRPGISMYGYPPDSSDAATSITQSLGLKPAISWLAKPTLVKELPAGRVVGYGQAYRCRQKETVATVPIGYADGYLRNMYELAFLTTSNGIKCPMVGRVSMDSITVKLPDDAKNCREFYVMTDDFNDVNSVVAIAKITNTIPYEVCTNLKRRIARIYETGKAVSLTVLL